MRIRKKLIEVALPLDAINKAAAHEKMPGIGPHPRGLHLWWARRPLAAARAVIFGQMVDDPSEYLSVLRADSKLRRKAESALKARLKLWQEARALAEKAKGSGLPITEPGPTPTLDEMLADLERQRLFRIIEDLVLWENTTKEAVLQAARDEIWQSWRRACAENSDHSGARNLFDRNKLPAFHDPFAGGGAIPVEAQRLGLDSYASDLNPVAVLINKAMIEIPPKFADRPPVRPVSSNDTPEFIHREWNGAQGLAEDVRYYGRWMRDEAEKRIGHLYPKVAVDNELAKLRPDLKPYIGQKLTVIASIWARTVKSPNPAFANVDVPLASSFMLSTKAGKEAYVDPVINKDGYRFTVKIGKPKNTEAAKNGTKLSRGANFQCLMSGTPMAPQYIKDEGKAGRMGVRLMAIVAEGERGRIYLPPTAELEAVSLAAQPSWKPETPLPADMRSHWTPPYGLTTYGDLFTRRQLVALTTFADLVQEARERVKRDALASGVPDGTKSLDDGSTDASAYADAIGVYLAFAVDRCCDFSNSCTRWVPGNQKVMNLFGKQAIAMSWDFPEAAILHETVGGFGPAVDFIAECILKLPQRGFGSGSQQDAMTSQTSRGKVVSTDPPYYDNIGYGDLSDFFYIWLRRSLRSVFPDLFATLVVPKAEELVATPYRHGGKQKAEAFFLQGMTQAMQRLSEQAHPAFPVTIYYAFKQSESDGQEGTTNTGWDTFLGAVIEAGFSISGTWPLRSEQEYRMIGLGTNVLASSIILVCRRRQADAPIATRREFVTALKAELPNALAHLQRGNIAPVDLAQAAIGPGMAVYTRYSKVLDTEGNPLSVREALSLINQTLDEALAEQEGDFDADSRWALTWFEESGFAEGDYGVAEQLSKSKNTSVAGMVDAGILASKRGKVRLLRPEDLPKEWDPTTDSRLTAWEIVHQLIRVLENGGEGAAAKLVGGLGAKAEIARELAYRLYTLCERKKRPAEALPYNGLVQSWPEITRLVREGAKPKTEQVALFGATEE
jgi:putative DNA methylase